MKSERLRKRKNRPRPCDGKKRFKSKRGAYKAMNDIRDTSSRENVPTRVYKCDACGFYHLTKKNYYGDL